MRPLRLVMQAFGPFAGRVEIDFPAPETGGLFLVHGPTGAGKTSVLDAICFALFGQASGDARQGQPLRSHHATAETPTEVSLDFRIGGESYRIIRSPQQPRPKKRGTGLTVEKARAALWRLPGEDAGAPVPLAERPGEVTDMVQSLLGLGLEQFRQVAMLPQGEFRRFLLAGSDERQNILRRLFGSGECGRLEEALAERRREVHGELDIARVRHDDELGRHRLATVAELELRIAALRRREVDARAQLRRVERSIDFGKAARARAAETERRLRALREAREEMAGLRARAEEMEEKRRRLQAAERAAEVEDVIAAWRQRREEFENAERDVDGARSAAAAARGNAERARQRLEEATAQTPRIEALRARIAQLEAIGERLAGLAELEAAAASLEARLKERRAALEEARAARDAAAARREMKAKALEEAKTQAARAAELRARVQRLEELGRTAERLEALKEEIGRRRRDLDAGRAAYEAARAEREELRARVARARQALLAARAAHLAATLKPGEPCPVCGSRSHPAPAAGAEETTAIEEKRLPALERALERAEAETDRLREDVEAARLELERLRAEAETLRNRLADAGEGAAAAKALAEARSGLSAAEAAHVRVEELEKGLTACEAALREAEGDERAAAEEVQRLEKDLAALRGKVSGLAEGLPAEPGTPAAAEAALAGAREELDSLQREQREAQAALTAAERAAAEAAAAEKAARERLDAARKRVEEAVAARDARLAEAGFADAEAQRAARMAAPAREAQAAEVAAFAREMDVAKARLARAEEAARGREPPDTGAIEAALASLERQRDEMHARLGSIDRELKAARASRGRLRDLEKEIARLDAAHGVLEHLAEVARGRTRTGPRISFERYVLGALFGEVLAAANARLERMSRGRYRLSRPRGTEESDRRRAAGLEMVVEDAFTGRTRPVETLSGGESFLAALSLALGLADVVQTRAGGVRLQALFIDEGFGSLDPEALDAALTALADLQRGGRLIGIISHVPELQERITRRLEVRPGRGGSRIIAGWRP